MKELFAGLMGMGVFFMGYLLGRMHGWGDGYNKAIKDVSKEVDDYFEAKCLCRTIKKDQEKNNETL